MSANFTPEMLGYTGQGPFRYWCQKVLPLVYDDSLSYLEVLHKVTNYLNNTISDVANVETNVDNLATAFNNLQRYVNDHIDAVELDVAQFEEYVTNYLTNLDVQDEINNKLDAMVTSGVMSQLISPIADDLIPPAVTSWLNTNVDPVGSAVVVDDTLTISGAAADAKVTGDEINAIDSVLNYTFDPNVDIGTLIPGKFIDSRNGSAQSADDSSVTDYISVFGGHTIYMSSLYTASYRSACSYDANKNFIRALATTSDGATKTVTLTENECFVRMTSKTTSSRPTLKYQDTSGFVNVESEEQRDFNSSLLQNRQIDVGTLIAGKYISQTGAVYSSEDSSVTDFVNVIPEATIIISGMYLQGGRSACSYDLNKKFVRAIAIVGDGTQKEVILNTNEHYVRVTSKTGQAIPRITYKYDYFDKEKIDQDRYSNYFTDVLSVSENDFSSGYINYNGTDVVESQTYVHTDFLEVLEGATITLKGFASTVLRYLFVYDDNYNLIAAPVAESSAYIETYDYTLPFNAKYIRFNAYSSNYQSNTSVSYKTMTSKLNKANYFANIVREWTIDAHNDINNLFNQATQNPTITLIDDDTISVDAVTNYYNACADNGIKGGYAVLTANLENNAELKNLLLSYEEKGFSMNIHAYSQINAYNSGASRNIVDAEANFVKGLRQMREFGFLDYNYWCTPFGVSDSDIQNVAKRHGLKCLIRSGIQTAYVGTTRMNPFAIPRASLNPNAEALGQCKTLVDSCAANNGWLLITTHFYEQAWSGSTSIFDEFVQYALGKGCVFKTISEAWIERKPIFELYEMF